METSQTLSFGRYLKAIRESRDISLSAVADHLRVSVWHLTLIEAEAHEKLPDEVYVKGTLRAYAAVLGVDADDIIDRYQINRRAYYQALKSEQDLLRSGKQSLFRMMLSLGVLALVMIVSIKVYDRLNHPESDLRESSAAREADGIVDFIFVGHDVNRAVENNQDTAYRVNDRLHLKIVAISETSIDIRVDGADNGHYTLNPKDEMFLEASERFTLRISDAAGVDLSINGRPVALDVGPGQPVNVVLGRTQTGKQ